MRGIVLFVAGTLFGLLVQLAIAQEQRGTVVALNHVALSVPNLDEAVTYYTETMGFPEAFRVNNKSGEAQLVYVQVSAKTFIELQPANADRPPGINHFGLQVNDMADATTMFKERGADVSEIRTGSTKSILSNIHDPNGNRVELLELPPGSLTSEAMLNWE